MALWSFGFMNPPEKKNTKNETTTTKEETVHIGCTGKKVRRRKNWTSIRIETSTWKCS